MPTNYDISQPNDISNQCEYCGGVGCKFCTKPTCPVCNGRIKGDACEFCTGTKHGFTSDLIQNHNVSLPNTTVRPFAGERPAQVVPPQIVMSRRR